MSERPSSGAHGIAPPDALPGMPGNSLLTQGAGAPVMPSLFTMSHIRKPRPGIRSHETIGLRSSSSPTWIPAHARSTPLEASGGARRDRTDDLMLAKHALSQLSYGPSLGLAAQACVPCSSLKRRRRRPSPRLPRASARAAGRPCERCRVRGANPGSPSPPRIVVGLGRLERPTSPLSGVRSNHLSYRPGQTRPGPRATPDGDRAGSRPIRRYPKKGKRRRLQPRHMGL